MLRHEQQTIRMALAAALHHSAGPKEIMVELQQYAALRGQNTGARAREEVVQDAHVALRGQRTPPPGVRPGSLVDAGPQRSGRTVRRSSGKDPLLVVASLADASADGVDAATLSFLTASALEARRKEEEEEERKAVETARRAALSAWQLRHTRAKVELNTLVNLASTALLPSCAGWWSLRRSSMSSMPPGPGPSRRKKKKRRKR